MTPNRDYIDGEWRESVTGETFETVNPAAPGEVVASYQQSNADDAAAAVAAAADARTAWADTPGPQRGRILREAGSLLADRKQELTEQLTREEGKTHAEAGGEVQRAIDIFRYYAQKTRDRGGAVAAASGSETRLYTVEEPVGVAALITPWNYPIAIPAWKVAPALAAGNTAVLKPASRAPGPALAIVEALAEAGAPDGVINLVTGPGRAVGNELITHEAVDAVSFTGSSEVGNVVYDLSTDGQKRVQTEMGGKNPTVVTDSADVAEAADIVADGAFGVTGQACTACSRAIVHEDVHAEFVDAIAARAEAIEVGPGDEADMGPQVSQRELDSTLDYIETAHEEGNALATGGDALQDGPLGAGYFVEPTVFTDVDPSDTLAQDEVFGPVVAVLEVSDFEEAMGVCNDVNYGLSASIVTDDHGEANRFVRDVESGVAKVNEKTTGLELHVPFGGVKNSSSETWREQGDAGLDFYTIEKTVYDSY